MEIELRKALDEMPEEEFLETYGTSADEIVQMGAALASSANPKIADLGRAIEAFATSYENEPEALEKLRELQLGKDGFWHLRMYMAAAALLGVSKQAFTVFLIATRARAGKPAPIIAPNDIETPN